MNQVAIIIQARMSSKRLPGKSLMRLGHMTLIEHVFKQVKKSSLYQSFPNHLWLATSTEEEDGLLSKLAMDRGLKVFRGPIDNVRERFRRIVLDYNYQYFVRVTGDNPFIEASFIDLMYKTIQKRKCDYIELLGAPKGTASQVATSLTLEADLAEDPYASEHVFPKSFPFNICRLQVEDPYNYPELNFSVDTIHDFERVQKILTQSAFQHLDINLSNILKYQHEETRKISNLLS